jgi:hypothetical protein
MEILKVVFPLKHHLIHMWFENDVIWIENIFLQFNMGKLFPVSFEISSWGGHHYILCCCSGRSAQNGSMRESMKSGEPRHIWA